MSQRSSDFYEAVNRRMCGSVTCAVMMLPIILCAYLWSVNFSTLHPLTWVKGSLSMTLSLSTWLYGVLLALIVALVGMASWKHFSVLPATRTCRLLLVWDFVRPDRLVHMVCHGVGGAVSVWALVRIVGGRYSTISQSCLHDVGLVCLNEYHVFMVCYGMFVGMSYSIHFFLYQQYHIIFPALKQPRYFQIKNAILPTLSTSFCHVIRTSRYYYVCYFLIGGYIKSWICASLRVTQSTVAVDSIYGLMDIRMFGFLLMTGWMVQTCWTGGVTLFKIFVTQPYDFPVETMVESRVSLVGAMASTGHLLRYHGYQSLHSVALYSPVKRRQIFSLSQPGGHPHNWRALMTECLRMITELTAQINHYNDTSSLANSLKRSHQSADSNYFVGHTGRFDDSGVVLSHRTVAPPVSDTTTHTPYLGQQTQEPPTPLMDKVLLDLQTKPFIAYFIADIPELLSHQLLASSQTHIWAVEALSVLVYVSLEEDQFGVVQKHVSDIIVSLLGLQEAVDRHGKLGLNGARRVQGKRPPVGSYLALRVALRSTIKSALYRITRAFGTHLSDLNLPNDYMRRMHNFLEFKE